MPPKKKGGAVASGARSIADRHNEDGSNSAVGGSRYTSGASKVQTPTKLTPRQQQLKDQVKGNTLVFQRSK